jgi:hypothetical protein
MKARVLSSTCAMGLMFLAFTFVAVADAPVPAPFQFVFDDVNPCTRNIHTVTITGTSFVHHHDSRIVGVSHRTITTSPTGFVGHGTDSFVENGQVVKFRLTDILTSPTGARIRARFVFVQDVSTGAVKVEKGAVTCLRHNGT